MRTTIVRDGFTLEVEVLGDGEPLVFLHGLGSRGATAIPLLGSPPGLKLVLPDQRGHGGSTPVRRGEDYALPEMVADVQAIVAELDLAPAIVGGGSMGAAVALAYALATPEDFRALVVCAPALSHEPHPAAGDFAALADRIDEVGLARAAAETRDSLVGGGLSAAEADAAVEPWFEHDEASLAHGMRSVLHWRPFSSLEELERIELPTAIVAHPFDVWHPLELAQAICERIPRSELTVLPSVGAAWEPGRMGAAIVETLDRLGVRTG